MNILYLHGFGSCFTTNHPKVKALKKIGKVHGVDIDYSDPIKTIKKQIREASIECKADLIVGTSMGGWFAASYGKGAGIPFVSINPATNPSESLAHLEGQGVDFTGREYYLSREVIESYSRFETGGFGLILLDEGDELFNANLTEAMLEQHYKVVKHKGGSHRFDHMKESIEVIQQFYNIAEASYGF